MIQFIYYPKCSTCMKALKHLKEKELSFQSRDIVLETPTKEELKQWIERKNEGIKPFFNTAGQVYKTLKLKDKINELSIDEAVELLSTYGMLIKRPLLVLDNQIILGYKKEIYEKL